MIRGGEVMDPGGGLRGRLDVGIRRDKIAEVAAGAARGGGAAEDQTPKAGKVTPGLVDVHAHIFEKASDMGEHTDRFCNSSGVTTVCDAGVAARRISQGFAFVAIRRCDARRAFVNLSAIGVVGLERGGELVALSLCGSGRLRRHHPRQSGISPSG